MRNGSEDWKNWPDLGAGSVQAML